jgi:hypothetical protein
VGCTGGHSTIVLTVQLINKNIIKKLHCGLRCPLIDVLDSITNQNHASVMEEVQGKRLDGGGEQGIGNTFILGAIEVGRG